MAGDWAEYKFFRDCVAFARLVCGGVCIGDLVDGVGGSGSGSGSGSIDVDGVVQSRSSAVVISWWSHRLWSLVVVFCFFRVG